MLQQATYDAVRPTLLTMLGLDDEYAAVPLPRLLDLYQAELADWLIRHLEASHADARLNRFAEARKAELYAFNAEYALDKGGCRAAMHWVVAVGFTAMGERDVDLGRAFQTHVNNMPATKRTCIVMLMLLVFLPDMLRSPDLPRYRTSLNAALRRIAPEVELLLAQG